MKILGASNPVQGNCIEVGRHKPLAFHLILSLWGAWEPLDEAPQQKAARVQAVIDIPQLPASTPLPPEDRSEG